MRCVKYGKLSLWKLSFTENLFGGKSSETSVFHTLLALRSWYSCNENSNTYSNNITYSSNNIFLLLEFFFQNSWYF